MTRALLLVALALGAMLSSERQAQQPPPAFRSGVEVVTVPAVVTNGTRPVAGLTTADFELLDNGVAQAVTSAPIESLAVDVTLVLDTSGSLEGRALEQLKADVQTIGDDLQTGDRVRLLTFADNVTDVFGLQPGGTRLPVDRIAGGGATSLYAALAAALMRDPAVDRPQLLFAVSDGRDNTSFLDVNRVLALTGHSSAALYIALVDPSQPVERADAPANVISSEQTTVYFPKVKSTGLYGGVRAVTRSVGPFIGGPNVSALQGVASRTGGALYDRPPSGTLPGLFRQALEEFRSSYMLTYTPTGVTRGGWHAITVRVKNQGYVVRARKGYDGG